MKETSKIIIVLTGIIIVIITTLTILININKSENEDNDLNNSGSLIDKIDVEGSSDIISNTTGEDQNYNQIERDNSISTYYQLYDYLKQYFNNIKEKKSADLYYIADNTYLEKNKLTENNIITFLSKYNNVEKIEINDVYVKKESNLKEVYFIKISVNSSEILYFIYAVDNYPIEELYEASRYSFNMCTEEEYTNYINGKEEYKSILIKNNGHNSVSFSKLNEEDIAIRYFIDFNSKISKNPKEAYNLLSSEYREKKFTNYDEFLKYINTNELTNSAKKIMSKELNKGYATIQEVITDQNNNKFIINFNYKQYEIMLDDYTILSDKDKAEYNELSSEEKVGKNIERFIDMINDRDYYQAYSKLSKQFKESKFKDQSSFEEYIKENIFQKNDKVNMVLDRQEVEANGEVYIVKARLSGFAVTKYDNVGDVGLTVIMKLLNNYDYELSFSV
mgnify:FL=1